MTPATEIRLSFKFYISVLKLNTWFAIPLRKKKTVSNTLREDIKSPLQLYGSER